jgi:Zn finger protein HypA/HybF involved in hydrogenase expression
MHETGLVRDLIHRLDKIAHDANAQRVTRAEIWLGALSHMSTSHFRHHFEEESPGTLAENAALTIELSEDPYHPDAQSVIMRNVELEM